MLLRDRIPSADERIRTLELSLHGTDSVTVYLSEVQAPGQVIDQYGRELTISYGVIDLGDRDRPEDLNTLMAAALDRASTVYREFLADEDNFETRPSDPLLDVVPATAPSPVRSQLPEPRPAETGPPMPMLLRMLVLAALGVLAVVVILMWLYLRALRS
ncbi:hypothetical protein [Catenuloplanes japonicus]|uniref:hypothetical protein n=1 Tax=Catenuloplanes japonicus TaxID=33876 RepID=UPI0005253713|nr:hypothetical protein [Catenuloplanes japonicus]